MPKQLDLDKTYINMAKSWSNLSHAIRNKVGCLIVKNGTIISDGYNGTPRGFSNDCEVEKDKELVTKPEVLHAETNAIAKVAQSTESSKGATLFCTHAPCIDCAKLIYQSGIETMYYRNDYRSDAGVKFLKLGGVNVHHYDTGKVPL